jgi:hypothetical protein
MSDCRYSEQIMQDIVDLMNEFLIDHTIAELMELVTGSIATKEQQ